MEIEIDRSRKDSRKVKLSTASTVSMLPYVTRMPSRNHVKRVISTTATKLRDIS